MNSEVALKQMATRLQSLEEKVEAINVKLKPHPDTKGEQQMEFVILADGREVWSGPDLEKHFLEIHHRYPDAKIAISWRSVPFTWV